MNIRRKTSIGLTYMALSICGAMPVAAQIAAPATPSDEGLQLDEIQVVARRQSENLQSVPVSVQAFDQAALTQKAIFDEYSLATSVSGLSVNANGASPSQPSFSIRGRGESYGAASGSVETYFADIPLSAPFEMPTLPPQFFDMASVEVLKGPQGTLFGRNTTGGAVVLVPQAPTDKLEGYARVQGGTFSDFQFEGALNVPLIPDVASLRVAVFHWSRLGYMTAAADLPGTNTPIIDSYTGRPIGPQTFNNQNENEARVSLRIHPTSSLDNTTIFTVHTDKTRESPGSGPQLDAAGNTIFEPGYGTYLTYTDNRYERPATNVFAAINTTTYELPNNLSLKNILGYINATGHNQDPESADGTPTPLVDVFLSPYTSRNQQVTDELQLHGRSFGDQFTWTVGALLDRTWEPSGLGHMNVVSLENSGPAVDPDHPGAVQAFYRFVQNTINSYSAFASGTYKIAPNTNLTAGFRATWDDVAASLGTATQVSSYRAPVYGPINDLKSSGEGNTYNIEIDNHPTDKIMVYGGFRHGYKRGGFNASQPDPTLSVFLPEQVNNFHVGVKADFNVSGIPVRVNLEPYYDIYHGMQTSYLSIADGGLTTVTTNVPATTYRGFDLDLELKPASWATITASYTFIDAFFTKWPDNTVPGSTIDLAQNFVPFTSKNTVNVSARLTHDLPGNVGEVVFAPSYHYQDKFFNIPINVIEPAAEAAALGQFNAYAHGGNVVFGYSTVDLRFEWNRMFGSAFNFAVNGTNVTDRVRFAGNTQTLGFGAQGNTYLPPRMFTAEISTKF
jgi:iron complex outermembrane recepter protein